MSDPDVVDAEVLDDVSDLDDVKAVITDLVGGELERQTFNYTDGHLGFGLEREVKIGRKRYKVRVEAVQLGSKQMLGRYAKRPAPESGPRRP